MLDKMDVENVPADAPVWEKVVQKLRTTAMPPAGMPRPDNATYESFATYLETKLDRAAEANPNPGEGYKGSGFLTPAGGCWQAVGMQQHGNRR